MQRFAVKNYSKRKNHIRILISGDRLNGDWDLERSRHAHNGGTCLRRYDFEFLDRMAHQAVHIVAIVFTCHDCESRRLNEFFWLRRKIGRHECRTVLLTLEYRKQNSEYRNQKTEVRIQELQSLWIGRHQRERATKLLLMRLRQPKTP